MTLFANRRIAGPSPSTFNGGAAEFEVCMIVLDGLIFVNTCLSRNKVIFAPLSMMLSELVRVISIGGFMRDAKENEDDGGCGGCEVVNWTIGVLILFPSARSLLGLFKNPFEGFRYCQGSQLGLVSHYR